MNFSLTQLVAGMVENQAGEPARQAQPVTRPVSAEVPTKEWKDAETTPSPAVDPQEVVKVHSDDSTGMPIMVYQFVDSKSNSVILQVPSEQMLSLVQEIRQRLSEIASQGPMSKAVGKEKYGNQL
jgi:hypothetical protein